MKNVFAVFVAVALSFASLAGAQPHGLSAHGGSAAAVGGDGGTLVAGRVVETMDSGGYTYVLVDDGQNKVWAAAPRTKVAVGDRVVVPQGSPMPSFHSKTLDRTFEMIYFVPAVQVAGGGNEAAAAHAKPAPPKLSAAGVAKAEGGYSVGELFSRKEELAGKEVAVRGKVAKFSGGIMGKNWIHVQDGTGTDGRNDLTVTSDAEAKVGDTVLVRGKLGKDKDLGYGYKYEVIVEDAAVKVE